ncbi:hypothetical protein [Petrotoga sp. 9PWA.NaAc.5.4]|uniref:hypothetical protein n=1 Tax=Petrotoga sp. 9PWA.NaAc.5.4 TaxID=1434328 RepID=UPI000CBF7CF9|nr:hypothetical protein [Petrotoga sp. 9PWA.NaAc.5.4]PNR96668.1 hypothetical protein X924_01885 [Petrotoga sp. 9PWA.NaAc.5.4]
MISGVSSQLYEPMYLKNYTQNVVNSQSHNSNNAPVMSKDEIKQLTSFMLYKQTGITMKLVRTVGALYEGSNLDILA